MRRRLWFLTFILGSIWFLNRIWSRRFHTVRTVPVFVDGRSGGRVVIRSVFDAAPEDVWQLVKSPAALQKIASPWLAFIRQDGHELPAIWPEGETIRLKLYAFGLVPLGRHEIILSRVDDLSRMLYTRESGDLVPVWNHLITVGHHWDNGPRTLYTDQVDLAAGQLSVPLFWLASLFFRYRQMRLRALLRNRTI